MNMSCHLFNPSKRAAMAAVALFLAVGWGCSDSPRVEDGGVLLVVADKGDSLSDLLVEQGRDYLTRLAGSAPQILRKKLVDVAALRGAARDRRAALVIVLDAEFDLDPARPAMGELGPSAFVLQAENLGDWDNKWLGKGATVLLTRSATRLGRQYALYEALRRFGCRFYHPEQEYVPRHKPADLRRLALRPTALARQGVDGPSTLYQPDFAERGFTFHGSHPLEHL